MTTTTTPSSEAQRAKLADIQRLYEAAKQDAEDTARVHASLAYDLRNGEAAKDAVERANKAAKDAAAEVEILAAGVEKETSRLAEAEARERRERDAELAKEQRRRSKLRATAVSDMDDAADALDAARERFDAENSAIAANHRELAEQRATELRAIEEDHRAAERRAEADYQDAYAVARDAASTPAGVYDPESASQTRNIDIEALRLALVPAEAARAAAIARADEERQAAIAALGLTEAAVGDEGLRAIGAKHRALVLRLLPDDVREALGDALAFIGQLPGSGTTTRIWSDSELPDAQARWIAVRDALAEVSAGAEPQVARR